jgi:hypothetical protein
LAALIISSVEDAIIFSPRSHSGVPTEWIAREAKLWKERGRR